MNYKNIFSLLMGHFANYLVPFSMIFILSRSLNQSDFTFFMYAQVVLVWSGMFIEYGFTLRAIRYLKQADFDVFALYNLIQSTKLVLASFSTILVMVILYFSGLSTIYNYFLVCLIFVFFGFRANWYFIALEKTSVMTIVDLIVSILFVSVLFFINNSNLTYVLMLMVLYRLIPALIHFTIVSNVRKIRLVTLQEIINELRAGFSLFLHVFSVSFYSTFNSLYLGLVFQGNVIVNYINAERLNNIAVGIYYPIVNAFIPRIMAGDKRVRKIAGIVIISYSLLCIFGVYMFGEFFIKLLFSDKYLNSIGILKTLCFVIPFIGLNYFIGQLVLIPLGLEKLIAKVTLIAAGINVSLLLLFINITHSIVFLPYLVIGIEVLISILLLLVCVKRRVFND
ncbi:oligosaccharide flippase family protein [Photobacterium damselae]|uniref:oligosaccharide flippase family protein n=1 Tax=Photobacterium damselae TaxID=38293 RepID=UPI0015A2E9BA|nr:oligosaccharide flippase family protein [Photobacterium damselae]NVO61245.1 oligosaccharide flippase family protein [Photobacterium damselae subsp. damselae]